MLQVRTLAMLQDATLDKQLRCSDLKFLLKSSTEKPQLKTPPQNFVGTE